MSLNIWMAGMSLKSFCKLVILNVVLALTIPGLALLPSKLHFLTEIGLVTHALLLCHIENRFFNYSGIYYYGFEDDVMYPSYMVLVTTFVSFCEKTICGSSNWCEGSLDFDMSLFCKAGYASDFIKVGCLDVSCSVVGCNATIASLQG